MDQHTVSSVIFLQFYRVNDGSRTVYLIFLKSTRYIFNLKWIYFYKIKGQDMPLVRYSTIKNVI
jgi:hypothetical protein